jgi:hypothetical protein
LFFLIFSNFDAILLFILNKSAQLENTKDFCLKIELKRVPEKSLDRSNVCKFSKMPKWQGNFGKEFHLVN